MRYLSINGVDMEDEDDVGLDDSELGLLIEIRRFKSSGGYNPSPF